MTQYYAFNSVPAMSWRRGASRGRRTTRRRRRNRGRPVICSCLPRGISSHSENEFNLNHLKEAMTEMVSCLEIALRVAGGPRGQVVDQPHFERVLPPLEVGNRPVGVLRAPNTPSEICNLKKQVVKTVIISSVLTSAI